MTGILKKTVVIFTVIVLGLSVLKAQNMDHDCSYHKSNTYTEFNVKSRGVAGQEVYDMQFVKLELELTNQNNSVKGVAHLKARTLGSMDEFVLELHSNLIVDSVYFQNKNAIFSHNSGILKIQGANNLSSGTEFTASVYYHGSPPNGGFFNGFSNAASPTWGNKVTWSLSQPNNAFQWWPCKQVLTDKLDSAAIWITVDSALKAGSNGILENITTSGNKKRFEWNYPHPIAYYLISVSVAEYIEYNFNVNVPGISKPVFVQNFIYNNPGTLTAFKSEIDKTADMLKVFSALYGPYPFADMKYGHCMAPFSGGMEHNTMTTQGTFNTTLTAHELGHQWWGDDVTCKSWKDIWINEAFARYSEYIYLKSYSNTAARVKLDDLNKSVLSGAGGSVFVKDTVNAGAIFNGRLTYDKGGLLVHMIRFELNDDSLFFKILRNFLQQYKNKNAGVSEFKLILETMSNRSFTTFFNQWYYGEGQPTFDVYYNTDSAHAVIRVIQKVSKPSATAKFETPLELKLSSGAKDTIVRVLISGDTQQFQIPLNRTITSISVDPNQWIIDDTGVTVNDVNLKYKYNSAKNLIATKLSVYPNPTGDFLFISGLNERNIFDVYSADGRLIISGRIDPGKSIDTAPLSAGNYVLKIGEKNIKFTKI